MWSVIPMMRAGYEIREVPFLPGAPRLERATFSGGVNISASERNKRRVDEAMRVYGFSDNPGVLFCSPWVAGLLRAAIDGRVPGVDRNTGQVSQ